MAGKTVNLQNINTEIECSVKVLNKTICLKWTNLQEENFLVSLELNCLFKLAVCLFSRFLFSGWQQYGQLVSFYYWKKIENVP